MTITEDTKGDVRTWTKSRLVRYVGGRVVDEFEVIS
jgi:hypothetical protein